MGRPKRLRKMRMRLNRQRKERKARERLIKEMLVCLPEAIKRLGVRMQVAVKRLSRSLGLGLMGVAMKNLRKDA